MMVTELFQALLSQRRSHIFTMEKITAALIQLDFYPSPQSPDKFWGTIDTNAGPVHVEMDISDLSFMRAPIIMITQVSMRLFPEGTPHIGPDRSLCYLEREAVSLDSYKPISTIRQCIAKAQEVMNDLLEGKLSEDIDREFLTLWGLGDAFYIVSPLEKTNTLIALIESSEESHSLRCVVGDEQAAQQQIDSWGDSSLKQSKAPVIHIPITHLIPPEAYACLPIRSVEKLLEFLRAIHHSVHDTFIDILAQKRYRSPYIVFIFTTSGGCWGGLILVDDIKQFVSIKSSSVNKYKSKLKKASNFLSVYPRIFEDATDEFIYSRNMTEQKNLFGLKIAVIGVGTIGGYISRQLVQLGAGKQGGHIDIYDNDKLGSGNLGRHYLDRRFLGKYKSTSIVKKLSEEFFNLSIKAHTKCYDVHAVDMKQYDLIIDATGFDGFSATLNQAATQISRPVPILHVWIEGAGDTLIAFWNQQDAACHRCLHYNDYLSQSVEITQEQRHYRCGESYMPYISPASEIAASLAVQSIYQQINGNSKNNLLYIQLSKKLSAKAKRITAHPNCEACKKI